MSIEKILSFLLLAVFFTKAMDSIHENFIRACSQVKKEKELCKLLKKIPKTQRKITLNEALIQVCASPDIPENKLKPIMNFLFRHGATVSYKNIYDQTPLLVAIGVGQNETIIGFLKKEKIKELAAIDTKSNKTNH